jgi:uncharacterized membrane protein (DUF373 family)
MAGSHPRSELRVRREFAQRFRQAELLLYGAVGVALALAGFALFGQVLYRFAHNVTVDKAGLAAALLSALDGLLLVFIFAELLHTIRAVIAEDALRTTPFLIVGIVSAIRRFIVASAEAAGVVQATRFHDLMLEISVLMVSVVLLGVTIWLLSNAGPIESRPGVEHDRPDE